MSFTRMDVSTRDDWRAIAAARAKDPDRLADRLLELLQSLRSIVDGHGVDQLTHSLQTATRAERAGVDDDVVLAALCHDAGRLFSDANHGRVAAEILRGFVCPRARLVVEVHQDSTSPRPRGRPRALYRIEPRA